MDECRGDDGPEGVRGERCGAEIEGQGEVFEGAVGEGGGVEGEVAELVLRQKSGIGA